MSKAAFTLGDLAGKVTGGNLAAMAKLINDTGIHPRLNENEPDPGALVARRTVSELLAMRADDRVGRLLGDLLGEG